MAYIPPKVQGNRGVKKGELGGVFDQNTLDTCMEPNNTSTF